MHQRNESAKKPIFPAIATVLTALMAGMISLSPSVHAKSADVTALERRVAELNQELERAKADLALARQEKDTAQEQATKAWPGRRRALSATRSATFSITHRLWHSAIRRAGSVTAGTGPAQRPWAHGALPSPGTLPGTRASVA